MIFLWFNQIKKDRETVILGKQLLKLLKDLLQL